MKAFAPNGLPILGTLESVPGRAEIVEDSYTRNADRSLDFEHAGGTTMFWDGARTQERAGKAIFLDEKGNEWTADEVRLETEPQPRAELRSWLLVTNAYNAGGESLGLALHDDSAKGKRDAKRQLRKRFEGIESFETQPAEIWLERGQVVGICDVDFLPEQR